MKMLFDVKLLDTLNAEKLLLECVVCKKPFAARKIEIRYAVYQSNKNGIMLNYCSRQCYGKAQQNKIEVSCAHCEAKIFRISSWLKKSARAFCSQSCATSYNNLHKTTGNRRSKLEVWLEKKLAYEYPTQQILYCDKTAINAELDIYFPNLKLAFELNGIYHYEPIHGQPKLDQVQSNDHRKYQACLEHGIELVIMDVSQLKYFKEQNCQKYLDIIKNIIDSKSSAGEIRTHGGFASHD